MVEHPRFPWVGGRRLPDWHRGHRRFESHHQVKFWSAVMVCLLGGALGTTVAIAAIAGYDRVVK